MERRGKDTERDVGSGGMTEVDNQPDPRHIIEHLDAARAAASVRTMKQRSFELLRVRAGQRLLDVGCGTGDFLLFAQQHGWQGLGVEASVEAADIARSYGAVVYTGALAALHERHATNFGAVSLLHVLEHVPHPLELLRQVHDLMEPDALLLLQVPNDFSEMQRAAEKNASRKGWWVAVPDHVNYFNFETLPPFVERAGFQVAKLTSNFPMEMFLMMGHDYVGESGVGAECHQRRVAFEKAMPQPLRRRMYDALASAGIGRDVILIARRV